MKVFLGAVLCVAVWAAFGQAQDVERSACECGLTRNARRIIGGTETKPARYPWMVALILSRAGKLSQFCGGTLISPSWVLTAAHCFNTTKIENHEVKVYLGDHDLSKTSELPSVSRGISKQVLHLKYNSKTHDADVALLKLSTPVTFTEYIRPVCMPATTFDPTGKMATVTGWGKTSEGGTTSMKLREVQVPIQTKAKCQSAYKGTTITITDNMICAGVPEGGKDSCQGDSGGPLIHQCSSTRFVQLGVVSFGVGCARPGLPGFYANIPKLLPWIASKMEGEVLCGANC